MGEKRIVLDTSALIAALIGSGSASAAARFRDRLSYGGGYSK